MYVCQECKSTQFEKIDGFLYCLVCQVQQKDFIEYVAETDRPEDGMEFEVTRDVTQGVTHEFPEDKKLTDNWTAWDAYNLIMCGFMRELLATGLVPKKLESAVLSLWMGYLDKTARDGMKYTRKKRRKSQRKSSRMTSLEKGLELLHIDKKMRIQHKSGDDKGLIFTPLSLSNSSKMKTLQKRMLDRCYINFLQSEEKNFSEIFANETIDTLGRETEDSLNPLSATFGADGLRFYNPFARRRKAKPEKKKYVRKTIPMSKAVALEILHLALLMCGCDVQLSDLLRFIREGHLSYAKVTHFFPPEIKLTKENYYYLETPHDNNMPSHIYQRKFGVDVAKKLEIRVIPPPDFPRLIKRYVTEMRLPVLVSSYAVLLSQLGEVHKLCSLKRAPKRIPNYEGMAAACIIVALKFLFGLDDRTEFLLSDMAKKTNKLLKKEIGNDSSKELFQFVEWKKLIELRKTILSGVHYPTQEAIKQNLSATGFIDMVIKESRDRHREERFEFYNQYYANPELMAVCRELLDTLIEPKHKSTLEFPPTLKPQTSYLKAILKAASKLAKRVEKSKNPVYSGNQVKDYEERKKQKTAESSGCVQFSEITEWAMTLLVKRYEKRQVFFMHKPTAYKELLRKNGYKIRTLSKIEQVKLMADSKDSCENSEDEYYEEDDEYGEDDSDSELDREDLSDLDEDGKLRKEGKPDEEAKMDEDGSLGKEGKPDEEAKMDEDGSLGKEGKPDETDVANKMDVDEEEPGDAGEKETGPPLVEEEEGMEMNQSPRHWKKIVLKEDGKEFTCYVGKSGNRSFQKIDEVPKKKSKGSAWQDIRYTRLSSSKKVYFVKDMAVMWKLDTPWLSEGCDLFFMTEVFRKTPHNFQWITRQFALLLEMKVREIYVECYKLELALEKAKKFSPGKIRKLIK